MTEKEFNLICPICKGIFSRDENHTCTCHETNKEFKSLSEKIFFDGITSNEKNSVIFTKDIKEKIQNAQKRLKEFCDDWVKIDKIFKEEFGEKLI